MLRTVTIAAEQWPLKTPFRISRGIRTVAEVVTVKIQQDDACGRGEGAVTPRYGESVEAMLEQLRSIEGALREGITRDDLRRLLPAGSARNAADCALWDLEAVLDDSPSGLSALSPIPTALTIGIDTPEAMGAKARALRGAAIVKVKVDGELCEERLRAIRAEVPGSRLIVDANEAWTMDLVERMQPVLADLAVEFLEQPLPAANDAALEGFEPLVPICADESCHTTADLARLRPRYGMVNIKLDKTGGLTEALDLAAGARAIGMDVMVGCMISTSLSIAPAFHVAVQADCADLDGPLWLTEDRPGGVRLSEGGIMLPPEAGFWG
ncbi:N-acetyl-D-Glu racemase DgcA [Sphingomonas sp. MMS24-J13]|uniref:N-acetyl-D-Glu racemase DgcA n=1 Tax=Sphingomonas sp. MMS24-J13 TaxID=3238686 RepID=UPI00384C11DE